jgi:hypothetical protein
VLGRESIQLVGDLIVDTHRRLDRFLSYDRRLRIVLYAPLLSQPNRATRAISVLIRAVSQILHTYEDLTSFDQLRPSWPQLRIITTCGQILILALAAGELQRTEATRLFGLVFDFLGRHCELWSCATELLVGFKRAAAVFGEPSESPHVPCCHATGLFLVIAAWLTDVPRYWSR